MNVTRPLRTLTAALCLTGSLSIAAQARLPDAPSFALQQESSAGTQTTGTGLATVWGVVTDLHGGLVPARP